MGIDSDLFITPLPDYLICQARLFRSVCMNALHMATSYCREEHMTCRSCAQDSHDQARRNNRPPLCPQCRAPARLKASVAIARIVDNLQVRCQFSRENGDCRWRGNAGDLPKHVATCLHKPKPCPHSAKGCAVQGTDAQLRTHLVTSCAYGMMKCPRVGCGNEYVRSTANIHDEICTFWRCQATPGCQTVTKREHLPQHETRCRATARQILEDSARIRSQNAELAAARRRIQELEAEKVAGPPSPLAVEKEPTDIKPDVSLRNSRPAEESEAEGSNKRPKVDNAAASPALRPAIVSWRAAIQSPSSADNRASGANGAASS